MEISPDKKDFLKLAKKYNLIIIETEFVSDTITPVSAYASLQEREESFFLESVEGQEKIARFSFIGFKPLISVQNHAEKISIKNRLNNTSKTFSIRKDILSEIEEIMAGFKPFTSKTASRFTGGFVGFLGYDNVRFFEPKLANKRLKSAQSEFVLNKHLITFDHKERKIIISSCVFVKNKADMASLYEKEKKTIGKIYRIVSRPFKPAPIEIRRPKKKLKYSSNFSRRDFLKAVDKAKQYIKKGDIIQVVLSQRLKTKFNKDPFTVYRFLRHLNPSAYMYYLDFEQAKIIGSSPEMLVRCEDKRLYTRPIAGTRPRGRTDEEDEKLSRQLLNDKKELAEHIMLVDLGRNDIGRAAEASSIKVPVFKSIEKFSHVMHIVSEVTGRLKKDKTPFDALRSCFPAGTVAGAPKIRAMEIIDELEPQPRQIYAGCVGYFSFERNLDTAIIIRTIVIRNSQAFVQAGAGIVLDSRPEKEYIETLNKAKAQLLAIEQALNN